MRPFVLVEFCNATVVLTGLPLAHSLGVVVKIIWLLVNRLS